LQIPRPHAIAISSDEIKNVMEQNYLLKQWPADNPLSRKIVSINILTDMNKIPIDAGTACFIKV
jgi:hypothetical protein